MPWTWSSQPQRLAGLLECPFVDRTIAALAPHFPAALERTARFRFVSIKPDGTIECLAERAAGS